MAAISDVTVTMTLEQPAQTIGFGVPALWVPGTDNTYTEYESIDDVLLNHKKDTNVYKNAAAFFKQAGHPHVFAVITFADMVEAFDLFSSKPWYFALYTQEDTGDDVTAQSNQDILLLSNLIEADQYRMMIVDLTYASSDNSDDFDAELYADNTRTILAVKKSKTSNADEAEPFAANLVGAYGGRTVGSLNFHDLVVSGLTADDWTAADIATFTRGNAMLYVLKANNIAQTTNGKTASGQYIDVIMGIDWIASQVRSELQNLLTETAKVTYDAAGIALMQSVVDNVMQTAYANGIIDTNDATQAADYTVTALNRADLDQDDINKRIYNGLSYRYVPSGSVDMINVFGTVEL